MALCWGEGHGSAIHDHSDSHCFMKMLHGSLKETRFAWPKENEDNEKLQEIGVNILALNDVCYMNGKYLQTDNAKSSDNTWKFKIRFKKK